MTDLAFFPHWKSRLMAVATASAALASIWAPAAQAGPSVAACGDFFASGTREATPPVRPSFARRERRGATEATVIAITVPPAFRDVPGEDWTMAVRRLPGKPWFSDAYFDGIPAAVQGDPRMPILVLGPRLARFFGFVMVDENTMLVPSVAKINRAIDELNARLPAADRILVRFYAQERGPTFGYLSAATEIEGQLSLPISTTSAMMAVHDVAFHVPAILATRGLVDRIHFLERTLSELDPTEGRPARFHADLSAVYDGLRGSFIDSLSAVPAFAMRHALPNPWRDVLRREGAENLAELSGRIAIRRDEYEALLRISGDASKASRVAFALAVGGVPYERATEVMRRLREMAPLPLQPEDYYVELMARRARFMRALP